MVSADDVKNLVERALERAYGEDWFDEVIRVINDYDPTREWKTYDHGYGMFLSSFLIDPTPVIIGFGKNAESNQRSETDLTDKIFSMFLKRTKSLMILDAFVEFGAMFGELEGFKMRNYEHNKMFLDVVDVKHLKLLFSIYLLDLLLDFFYGLKNSWERWLENFDLKITKGGNITDPFSSIGEVISTVNGIDKDLRKRIRSAEVKKDIVKSYQTSVERLRKPIGSKASLCCFCKINAPMGTCQGCGKPYCSTICQKKDWNKHQNQCSYIRQ